ncbi:MAG TPA: phytoene desaturase family protein [Blastocatellia bacterium]|nr:phytoene desaturase family protein [Blastocatellia bacterium]
MLKTKLQMNGKTQGAGVTEAKGHAPGAPRPRALPPVSVIGGGLGGLSAAIHLRLAGHPVSIYEANGRVGGRANLILRDGFSFDTGPSLLNYPWVFEQLFEAAGRDLRDYVRLLPVDPSVSFQWPDGTRFQLSSNLGRLLEECERLEPGSRPRMLAFLRDAEVKYRLSFDKLVTNNEGNFLRWLAALSPRELVRTGVWRSLDGELKRFFRSRHIREALGSYGMYLGGSPYELPGLFSILAYGELAYGLWLPEGGVYSLVSAIERLARELGVRIFTNRRVRRIVTRQGRVRALEFEDGEMIESPLVVSNVDVPASVLGLLDREAVSPRRRRRAEGTRMTPGVMTFYWGVRGEVEGLGHHTIFLPEDYAGGFDELLKEKRIPEQMPFYVSVPSATDRGLAPPGDTAMFVLVPTPLLSEAPGKDWGAEAREVKAKIIRRLRLHGVDIAPERIAVEEVYTPVEWRDLFGLHDGSAFGAAHTLSQMGPFRAPNREREIDGLYYVGASTTPGTGMPMVVLGGKMVASVVSGRESGARSQGRNGIL